MTLFGNGEEKREQKTQALMQKYGLEDLSDPRDKQAVQNIATNLMGNKLIELGAALQGNGADAAKMSYLNAIMEQNFIMIRQLDRIAKSLEK
jgi:hypothetical protein